MHIPFHALIGYSLSFVNHLFKFFGHFKKKLARILEWVAISYSKGSSWHRYRTWVSWVSCTGRQILYHCTIREAYPLCYLQLISIPFLSPGQPLICFGSIHLPIKDISYEWNHAIANLLCLVSFTWHNIFWGSFMS